MSYNATLQLPAELLPLYGTVAWNQMTESERITYSRDETVALLGAGIWFDNSLVASTIAA